MIFYCFLVTTTDATVAMAEKIAGTEASFVKLMNNKAKELGLKNTHFSNSTGLDTKNHYSSAYDMSIMAKELVKHKKILEFSSVYEDYLRKNTDKSFWLVNTNKLVKFYSYIDGLKTGYTNEAGYCLTATGMKNNMRLITVVMGENKIDDRTKDTIAMMDYGFNTYDIERIIKKDQQLGTININLGKEENANIKSTDNLDILNSSLKQKRNISYIIEKNKLIAPVKVGDIVGKINIYEDNKYIYSINLTIDKNVDKANIFTIFIRKLRDVLTMNINN